MTKVINSVGCWQRFKGTEVEEVTQDMKAVKIDQKPKETKTEEVVDEVSH